MRNLLLLVSTFFISLIIWLSSYKYLPEQVVMHFDSTGPTQFANKGFMFTMFMIISFILLLLLFIFLNIDNKNENKQKINKPMAIIGVLFVLGLNIVYILNVHDESLDTKLIFLIFVGCIFIIIGNYLPQTKYNSKTGIRNFASSANPQKWNKIQRFSGNIFVISGVLICFASFIPSFLYSIVAILIIIAAMLLTIQIYSSRLMDKI